jgi:hypothetical protein
MDIFIQDVVEGTLPVVASVSLGRNRLFASSIAFDFNPGLWGWTDFLDLGRGVLFRSALWTVVFTFGFERPGDFGLIIRRLLKQQDGEPQ